MAVPLIIVAILAGCGGDGNGKQPDRPKPALSKNASRTDSAGSDRTRPKHDGSNTGASTAPATPSDQPVSPRPPEPTTADGSPATSDGDAAAKAGTDPRNEQLQRRLPDTRPVHNDQRLGEFGIRKYESRRLRLYTDLPAEQAAGLPAVADSLFDKLSDYFGELPPSGAGEEFQVTGYIMKDRRVFTELRLLPEDLPQFGHGRHDGYRFWMNDQNDDYYRRHLMLHEFVHCFMTCVTGMARVPPAWYMEGMAEVFATHRRVADDWEFMVIPENKSDYAGLGRITLLQTLVRQGADLAFDDVMSLPGNSFDEGAAYAWSWALCCFLANHPRYGESFRGMGCHLHVREFSDRLDAVLSDKQAVRAEWAMFAGNLCDGFDLKRAAIQFADGTSVASGQPRRIDVEAAAGWQSARVQLEAGVHYRVTTEGRYVVATEPKPWVSEAQGVSVRYVDGVPLGRLLMATWAPGEPRSFLEPVSIGASTDFVSRRTGVLYLRVNDAWNELADNSGQVRVTLERLAD